MNVYRVMIIILILTLIVQFKMMEDKPCEEKVADTTQNSSLKFTYDNEAGYPLSHSLGTFFEWKYDVCELDEAVEF